MKDVIRIRLKRLDRWFSGRFDDKFPSRENWSEGGHFLQGVEIDLNSINEQDGMKRFLKRLGYMVDGEFEHVQSTLADFRGYTVLNGTMNFAFLCYDQLHIFRAKLVEGKVVDNRISFQTSGPSYGESRERAVSKVSGLITGLEVYKVDPKTVKVASGRLIFTIKDSLIIESEKGDDNIPKN